MGAAKVAEAAEMAAEGATTVEAETKKIASGAEVMSAQTLGLGRSSLQPLSRRLAARGAPCERHEDECWVAESGAIENMTQDSSNLKDYKPPPPGDEVESAGGVFLLVAGYGRLRLLMDQDNGTFKGVTRELTLDRVDHVP